MKKSTPACRPAGLPGLYFQSPEAKSWSPQATGRRRTQSWLCPHLRGKRTFPSLASRSCSGLCGESNLTYTWFEVAPKKKKLHNFSGRARDTGRLNKTRHFLTSKKNTKGMRFMTLADYVIPRNYFLHVPFVSSSFPKAFWQNSLN